VFFILSKLLDVLVTPLAWGLVLLVLYRVRWKGRSLPRANIFPLVAAGLLYVFSMGPVAGALVRGLERPVLDTSRRDLTYDVVIVLGGVVDTGPMSESAEPAWNGNIERVLTAFDLLRTGRAKDVLISGGELRAGSKTFREADIIAAQLRAWGIDDARIMVEGQSLNTRQNALFSADILRAKRYQSMLLVTSAFHMSRAVGCFRAVGLEPDVLSVDFRSHPMGDDLSILPRATYLDESTSALREYTGRVVYRLRGYSKSAL